MSDDLSKVVFGEPIECRGQKPDGFPTGRVPVQWSYNGRPYLDVTADDCRNFGMPHEPVLIRLPIDVPCNSKAPSDAITLTADQAAMIRKVLTAISRSGAIDYVHGQACIPSHLIQEARDAAALLPETVDADEAEVDRLMGLDLSTRLIVLAAIRRGRALERDSREG